MNTKLLTLSILLVSLFSCEFQDDNELVQNTDINVDRLSGTVQKGPFVSGSAVTIAELSDSLFQTGKTFSAQILDNEGNFELQGVTFGSPYVLLQADGFYFNEVLGETTSSRLVLNGISDLTSTSNMNINIISHLEKDRVIHLVGEGMPFAEAKKQAQKEILKIFGIDKEDVIETENMDISLQGEDHGNLLAASIILQGYRTLPELTQLLANINADLRTDGILDDQSIGSELLSQAAVFDLEEIRNNLKGMYGNITLPDFESGVNSFIENSGYEYKSAFEYPIEGKFGPNILNDSIKLVEAFSNNKYSMWVEKPQGTEFVVILSGGAWFYQQNNDRNWDVGSYNWNGQIFRAKKEATSADLSIYFDKWPWSWNAEGDSSSYNMGRDIKVKIYEGGDLNNLTSEKILTIE